MNKPCFIISLLTLTLALPQMASADPPLFQPPHGLLVVEIDENNQLFTNSATGEFDSTMISFNALGQTILAHNKGGFTTDGGVTIYPGGIAERDGDSPSNPATASSKKLLADDPGFFSDAGVFPFENYVLSVNYLNALRYFDGSSWGAPVNGEELRIFDLTNQDDTGGPPADLALTMTGSTSGQVGTINIGKTATAAAPINVTGVHGHVGYELSRPDDGIPAMGAYMIELSLSAAEFPSDQGPTLSDSDSIFVVFNNRLGSSAYADAVAAAQALPEPSTAVIIAAGGVGLALGARRRRGLAGRAGKSSTPWIVKRPKLGRDVPAEVRYHV